MRKDLCQPNILFLQSNVKPVKKIPPLYMYTHFMLNFHKINTGAMLFSNFETWIFILVLYVCRWPAVDIDRWRCGYGCGWGWQTGVPSDQVRLLNPPHTHCGLVCDWWMWRSCDLTGDSQTTQIEINRGPFHL